MSGFGTISIVAFFLGKIYHFTLLALRLYFGRGEEKVRGSDSTSTPVWSGRLTHDRSFAMHARLVLENTQNCKTPNKLHFFNLLL